MTTKGLTVLLASVFILGCAAQKPAPKQISFADPGLAAAISSAAGVPADQLTVPVLRRLRKLDASNKNIQNLGGIEACTGLNDLNLSHNRLTDIGPLAALRSLVRLDLSYNQISDLKPLSRLFMLSEIRLSNNRIADITPLSRNNDGGGLPTSTLIVLDNNPLGKKAIDEDIPYLAAEGVSISCSINRFALIRHPAAPTTAQSDPPRP